MRRRLVTALLWFVGLGVAAWALQWAGHGPLAPPPLGNPGRWRVWLEGRDPVVAAFSVLRLAALGGLSYLVVVTAIGAALRMAGAASLVRITDRFTVAPVRRMLAGTMSLGLAASGVVGVAATTAAAQTQSTTTTAPPSSVTMHLLGPTEAVSALPVPEVAPPPTERWTVKPGECFWSIAESVLTERWDHAPTDAEIVPYWQRLIEANRAELADRNDPDLIFPGQVFVVPAP